MALTWSGRRQVLYSGVGAVVVFILLVFLYEAFLTTPATCFNGKQDGGETGVDCGGNTCSLICADAAHPPIVSWARSFETSPSLYSAVAYVQNNNQGAGALHVPYYFQLFDENNILVMERDGVVNIPPAQTVPIIESNINVGKRTVVRTLFAFTNNPPAVWNKVPSGSYPSITHSSPVSNSDFSRVSTTVTNNSVSDVKNLTVVAILYNADGSAIATSKSLIQRLAGKARQEVVFTWPQGVPGTVQVEIITLPSF